MVLELRRKSEDTIMRRWRRFGKRKVQTAPGGRQFAEEKLCGTTKFRPRVKREKLDASPFESCTITERQRTWEHSTQRLRQALIANYRPLFRVRLPVTVFLHQNNG